MAAAETAAKCRKTTFRPSSDRQLDRPEAPRTPAAAGSVAPAAGRTGRRLGGRDPQDREVGDGADHHDAAQAGRRAEPVDQLLRRRGDGAERSGGDGARPTNGGSSTPRTSASTSPGSPGPTAASSWPGRWPRSSRARRAATTPWSTRARNSSSCSKGLDRVRRRRAGLPPGRGRLRPLPHRPSPPLEEPRQTAGPSGVDGAPSALAGGHAPQDLPLFSQPSSGRCRRGGEQEGTRPCERTGRPPPGPPKGHALSPKDQPPSFRKQALVVVLGLVAIALLVEPAPPASTAPRASGDRAVGGAHRRRPGHRRRAADPVGRGRRQQPHGHPQSSRRGSRSGPTTPTTTPPP